MNFPNLRLCSNRNDSQRIDWKMLAGEGNRIYCIICSQTSPTRIIITCRKEKRFVAHILCFPVTWRFTFNNFWQTHENCIKNNCVSCVHVHGIFTPHRTNPNDGEITSLHPRNNLTPHSNVSIIIYLDNFSCFHFPNFSGQNNSIIFHYPFALWSRGGRNCFVGEMNHYLNSSFAILFGSLIYRTFSLWQGEVVACKQFPRWEKFFVIVLRTFQSLGALLSNLITMEHEEWVHFTILFESDF